MRLSVEHDDWRKAFAEWEGVERENVCDSGDSDTSQAETCPCGHYPICELCWIQNKLNDRMTFVGNVCIKRFMRGYEVESFFKSLASKSKRLPEKIVAHALKKHWITTKDAEFYANVRNKRTRISHKQEKWRDDIERRVRHQLKMELVAAKAYAEERGLITKPERKDG